MSRRQKKIENVIIVGGGPAGYTAALYTARANLEPLVFEGFQWGGQLQNTTDVENYPGYPEGIMGPEMMNQFRAQAERFGTRFVTDDVDRVELSDGGVQKVFLGDEEHLAKTVILAMGAEPRRLGIPGEMELGGRGVSTCGVCDGAFFKDQKVIVIGGGDSAMEDSIFISKYASELTVVNRRDEFRASKIMHERAAGAGQHRLQDALRRRGVRRRRGRQARPRAPAQRRDRRDRGLRRRRRLRRDRPHPATRRSSPARSTPTRTATSSPSPARPGPTWPASSRSATSSTTPTARRSPPPAPAAWAPSTPSGTCATRRPRPRPTGSPAASRSRSPPRSADRRISVSSVARVLGGGTPRDPRRRRGAERASASSLICLVRRPWVNAGALAQAARICRGL